jgi:hypothetical protein
MSKAFEESYKRLGPDWHMNHVDATLDLIDANYRRLWDIYRSAYVYGTLDEELLLKTVKGYNQKLLREISKFIKECSTDE